MKIINVSTMQHTEFVDITSQVQKVVKEAGIKKGLCIIYCPHTTAGLTINENVDPSVKRDIVQHLDKLVPYNGKYTHLEGNADAHIKASLVGNGLTIIVENGRLILGTWQGIYFCEFDGPRSREVYIKIVQG